MPPVFVDTRELAERLGVKYNTVLSWVRHGKIPAIRDGRGQYMFNLRSVAKALCYDSATARRKAAKVVSNDTI